MSEAGFSQSLSGTPEPEPPLTTPVDDTMTSRSPSPAGKSVTTQSIPESQLRRSSTPTTPAMEPFRIVGPDFLASLSGDDDEDEDYQPEPEDEEEEDIEEIPRFPKDQHGFYGQAWNNATGVKNRVPSNIAPELTPRHREITPELQLRIRRNQGWNDDHFDTREFTIASSFIDQDYPQPKHQSYHSSHSRQAPQSSYPSHHSSHSRQAPQSSYPRMASSQVYDDMEIDSRRGTDDDRPQARSYRAQQPRDGDALEELPFDYEQRNENRASNTRTQNHRPQFDSRSPFDPRSAYAAQPDNMASAYYRRKHADYQAFVEDAADDYDDDEDMIDGYEEGRRFSQPIPHGSQSSTGGRPYRVTKDREAHDAPRRASMPPSRSDSNIRIQGRQLGDFFDQTILTNSRYSGDPNITHQVNKDPVVVDRASVSEAALLKRNVDPNTGMKTTVKRGYGASDPENIRIVNLREKNGLTFEEIKAKMNQERIKEGRNPKLTVCAVTSRYNRTAPILLAADGKKFVPLSQRGGRNRPNPDISTGDIAWTEVQSSSLVRLNKRYEHARWEEVAKWFNEEYPETKIDAKQAAMHYANL